MDVDYDEFGRAQLPGLLRFAAALTGDAQVAQDLVQDTLVRAYLKWFRVAGADRRSCSSSTATCPGGGAGTSGPSTRSPSLRRTGPRPIRLVGSPTGPSWPRCWPAGVTHWLAAMSVSAAPSLILRLVEAAD
jgi:hypothetical protein